jgi:hypothetical protein
MSPVAPTDGWWAPVLAAAAGGAVIVATAKLARRVEVTPAA